jgi:alkaline phosphatase
MKRNIIFVFLSFVTLISCTAMQFQGKGSITRPKNIVFLIGDGMGVSHITSGKYSTKDFNLTRFKDVGLVTTHSADRLITDSGASATAMATGYKTYNGAIAFSPEGNPLKTSLEFAEEQGMSTGLVSTSSLTHATPASFAAHVKSRTQQDKIAEQMATSGVDVLIGGGWGYFFANTFRESKRTDNKSPIAQLAQNGQIIYNMDDLRKAPITSNISVFLALEHLPKASERDYSLSELVDHAIKRLSLNTNGFFLMVEGSQIDWEAHDNNFKGIVTEMIDFDRGIGAALDYAEKENNTLVIVTADHETGGFAILGGSVSAYNISKGEFCTDGHSATMVPIFAFGPGSNQFTGILDNTDIGKIIIDYIRK